MKYESIDAYRYLSTVYDSMVNDFSFTDWGEYLITFFDKTKPALLEYACGTGNITTELAKHSSSMICVDISPEMLIEAQKKFKRTNHDIKFIESDMTEFVLNKPIDYIICACDGVNYITSEKVLNLFFKNAYSNLKPDGLFLFDISTDYKLKNELGNEFFYVDDDDATVFWQNSYNKNNFISEMNLTLFLKKDTVYYRYDEKHCQRAWRVRDIQNYLLKNGFKEAEAYNFGTRSKPKEDDERIQFVAKK